MNAGSSSGPTRRGRLAVRVWAPAAASIAVVLALAVPLAMHAGTDPAGGDPAGTDPAGTDPARSPPAHAGRGAPVEGMGTLLRDSSGATRLCAGVVVTADWPTSSAGCSPVSVRATSVDPAWLVHTTTTGQAYSDPVRVEGVYRDGTLELNLVERLPPHSAAPAAEPSVPCPPPPGGWRRPGYGLDSAAIGQEDELGRLAEAVRARPDRYTDVWVGHPEGRPSGEKEYLAAVKVMVVGTTGDAAQDRAALATIFRGNLCVHRVRNSAADLTAIADRLTSVRFTPIAAEPDVFHNKVRVTVVALDPPTVAVLDEVGRDALILEEPLLQWLD